MPPKETPIRSDDKNRPTTERLGSTSSIKLERYETELGIAGAVVHWGEIFEGDNLRSAVLTAFEGDEDKLIGSSGFTTLYRTPILPNPSDAIYQELNAADRLVTTTLGLNHWSSGDIEAIALGSGAPVIDDPQLVDQTYAAILAQRAGIDTDIPMHETYAACNSGGYELARILRDPDLHGKKVLLVAMEGLTRLFPGFDPQVADNISLQVFSNGGAAFGIIPGIDMRYLVGTDQVIVDEGALAANPPYRHLLDPNEGPWQEGGGVSMLRLPTPEKGEIYMKGVPTTKFFIKNTAPIIKQVVEAHHALSPDHGIDHVVSHHASLPVIEGLKRRLQKDGIELDIPWVVPDGNSSGATTLIALARQMSDFKEGDHVLIASFGAGASFSVFVVEIGRR